jgi:lipoate-protein ligase A
MRRRNAALVHSGAPRSGADAPGESSSVSTSISRWSAEKELAADIRLLEEISVQRPWTIRCYQVVDTVVTMGLALQARQGEILDATRCTERGVHIAPRQSGGGLVLLDDGMVCLAVALHESHRLFDQDLTRSYRWIGEACAEGLRGLGISARRIVTAEARARSGALDPRLRIACFAGWSPHESVLGTRKVVGLSQVRRQAACVFQVGILLRNQEGLADLVRASSHREREELRVLLRKMTVGVSEIEGRQPTAEEICQTIGAVLAEALE